MPTSAWLRSHYRDEPPAIRSVFLNPRLRDNIQTITALTRAFPHAYSVHARLVRLLYKAGRKQAAIRQWNRNTQLFPDSPSPYFQRATLAADSRAWLEAARWYTKCLRKDNGYFRTSVLFRRGECYLLAGKAELAVADFAALPNDHEDYPHEGFERKTKAQMLAAARALRRNEA